MMNKQETGTVLEINNLNVEYKTLTDRIVALKDISLKVGRKEIGRAHV